MKTTLDGEGFFGTSENLLCGKIVNDVARENFVEERRVIDIRDQVNLRTNVLICLFDPELQLLPFDQALRQGAALDDPVVIPPFEYV